MSDTTEQLPPNACFDIPSERDFLQEELSFGAAPFERVKFPYSKFFIENQAADDMMYMSCTRQGILHINNAQNIIEAEKQNRQAIYTKPRVLWEERIAVKPSVKTMGDTLQSAMSQVYSKKLISGYAVVKTLEQMFDAIDRGAYIYTGSADGDWKSVQDSKVYRVAKDGGSGGHAFCYVDYDKTKKVFKGVNSYGADNGFFDIPFDLVGTLYTTYAIYDANDELATEAFLALKKKKQLELTANSQFSELLIQLREETGKLPIFNNYRDGFGIQKELSEICVLRYLLNSK